jgi:hypothetical protein
MIINRDVPGYCCNLFITVLKAYSAIYIWFDLIWFDIGISNLSWIKQKTLLEFTVCDRMISFEQYDNTNCSNNKQISLTRECIQQYLFY